MHLRMTGCAEVFRGALLAVPRALLAFSCLLVQVQAGLALITSTSEIVADSALLNITWHATFPAVVSVTRSADLARL